MEFSTATLAVMFGIPLLAIIVIFLLARNWATPVEPPDGEDTRNE
ncbi:hypothetical protein RIF23_00725 [Lipingzhangella sp. LS1_29]|uniref:Uncharacterized protein n=1 Tax=Lipingzhangella rawalii TaxID=2055835 RepID=A0ABU2H0I4_9ACTN|nr:hypothetical protein [Lipingzhangella rawalii]MDS1268811.1 hypothetical protein [Lipingzhangella rawalii]